MSSGKKKYVLLSKLSLICLTPAITCKNTFDVPLTCFDGHHLISTSLSFTPLTHVPFLLVARTHASS